MPIPAHKPFRESFRGQLMIDDNRTNAKLHVKDVMTSDEGEYKCEITFLDITKNCPVVQLVKLTTLGKSLLKLFGPCFQL